MKSNCPFLPFCVNYSIPLSSLSGEDVSSKQEGILAAESVLKEAKRIAKTLPPERRKALEDISTEINAMAKELAELETTVGEDAKGEVHVCKAIL